MDPPVIELTDSIDYMYVEPYIIRRVACVAW